MAGRFSILLFIPLLLLGSLCAKGEDLNYNLHKKYFDLCSYKKECENCESCNREMYKVKIKNKSDKKIKSIFYQYYSPVYQKDITKEAVLQGDQVEKNDIGFLFICVRNGVHWAITKLVYDDDSSVSFVVDSPLRTWEQEPDECPCNTLAKEHKY